MSESTKHTVGKIEYMDNKLVKGFALNKQSPDEPIVINIVENGGVIAHFTPSIFRWDLKQAGYGRGYHGFIYGFPAKLLDGNPHELSFVFASNGSELEGGPVLINHKAEKDYTPLEATNLTGQKVLVIAPHPDDESLGTGGALALHVESGDPVKIVFLTDGSMADYSGRYGKDEYIEIREAEAREACSILGVADIEFWREPDRGLRVNDENINRLYQVLKDYKPDLIYCPSPHEFHPDHRVSAELLWRAVQKSGHNATIAFTEINTAIRINTLIDITPVIEKKKAACNIYKSQIENTPYTDTALSLNRFRSLTISESSSYAEGFFMVESSEVLKGGVESFSRMQFLSSVPDVSFPDPPLVSIIVRTSDRVELLTEALSSIVMQSYPNIEIVLVNDGESDLGTLVEEYGKYVDIRYINPKTPLGRTKAGNEGLRAAKGKYVNFLDDDDLFYANHVSKLALFLARTGQKAAYSDCEVAHYGWEGSGFELKGEKEPFKGVEHDLDALMVSNYLPNMVLMFEKSVLEDIGYADEELLIYEDWDLWIKLSLHYSPERLPGVSAEYRFFSDHGYDYSEWRMKILEKYKDYYEGEELDTSLLNRVDKLTEENQYLRNRLAQSEEGSAGSGEYRSPGSHMKWKALYTIKKYLPERLVKYLKSKQFKL